MYGTHTGGIREFAELCAPLGNHNFSEPFALSVKTLLTLDWYY